MDPLPCVSINTTHPTLTARRRGDRAAKEHETPPARTSPPRLAKAISATACSAGLARSGASLAGAALAHSIGSQKRRARNLDHGVVGI